HSRKAKKSPLSVWGDHWKRDADDEGTASLFVASAEFSPVRLDDRAGSIQPKTVMALPESAERFPAPIFRGALEVSFRLGQCENETRVLLSGRGGNWTFRALVAEGIREEFRQRGQQQLRVDMQSDVAGVIGPLHPCACGGLRRSD